MINKNIYKRPSLLGFTLIELLVVFSIIAILSAVGVYTFGNYNKSQVFQQGYDNFKQTLNVARSKAMSQVTPCQTGDSLNGYNVSIQTNTTYSLSAVCSGTPLLVSDYLLPSGMNFSTNNTTIFFPVVSGAAVLSGGVNFLTITLTGYTKTKDIIINSSGLIQ